MLQKLLGINWQTTLTGVLVIVGLIVKIIAALKVKDFTTVFTDVKEVVPDIIALLTGLGLIVAKDYNTAGAGTAAKKVDGQ